VSDINRSYQAYREWCERHGYKPAPFDVWKSETGRLSDYPGPQLGRFA
jgi:hypothetical protein